MDERASGGLLGSRRHRLGNVAAGAAVMLVGAVGFVSAGSVQGVSGTTHGLPPSFLPRVVTGLLILTGLVIALSRSETRSVQDADDAPADWLRVGASLLAITLYVLLVAPLGFVISSALYLAAQALILAPRGRKPTITAVVVAVALPIPVYLAFVRGLSVLLPVGLFG
ncbi:tripartite tricarboxylate transporter TctB family protein [Pseudonocardia sichuanensis]